MSSLGMSAASDIYALIKSVSMCMFCWVAMQSTPNQTRLNIVSVSKPTASEPLMLKIHDQKYTLPNFTYLKSCKFLTLVFNLVLCKVVNNINRGPPNLIISMFIRVSIMIMALRCNSPPYKYPLTKFLCKHCYLEHEYWGYANGALGATDLYGVKLHSLAPIYYKRPSKIGIPAIDPIAWLSSSAMMTVHCV